MPVDVYRCAHCGREVLVRILAPMTPAEIARRIEEERRPAASGLPGQPAATFRLRDDIWLHVSAERTEVPREVLPEQCPACNRSGTLQPRGTID
ncbi:MAG: hypothetical protein K1X87_05065 [Dehalococcoidia bacterium]|mgnify:CR=1 FL=1|nr:hypothetical protein [Dehalococcoidia bacterium]HRC62178.1 hypothetical protein [Dehalococcoidia bacterium]